MKFRLAYLSPSQGPVVSGLEDHEKIYALDQAEYLPIRTLSGQSGASAIYRCELNSDQRQMIADGADILIEILHLGGPLAPSRVMLLNESGEYDREGFSKWFIDVSKVVTRKEKSDNETGD